jgi:hypothetical protein
MTDIFTSPITGWIGAILVAVFVAVAGKYFADKYTDQRKRQEGKSSLRNEFERCQKRMPELFDEMKTDLAANPFKSEFVLLDVRLCYGGFPDKPLTYHMNDQRSAETYKDEKAGAIVHSHLLDKVKILEGAGFVRDISATDVPYFRMSDEFREMLQI